MVQMLPEFTTEYAVDFSGKTDILGVETKYADDASGMGFRPEGEDSLENTFSCVPKVQGSHAESLRQTDRDMYCDFRAVLMCGLLILFSVHRKKDIYNAR